MQCQHFRPRLLTGQADAHGIPQVIVPTTADFDGHRQRSGISHRLNDRRHQTEILETPRPSVTTDHLLHRTPEVDVDEVRLIVIRHQRGRLGHTFWV